MPPSFPIKNEAVRLGKKGTISREERNRHKGGELKAEQVLRISSLFQVPQSPYPEAVMFLTVEVEGPTHGFRSRKTVLVKSKDSLVFVQTDKPIYKPGQTGMTSLQ